MPNLTFRSDGNPETMEISYKVIHTKPKAMVAKDIFNKLKKEELAKIVGSEFTPTSEEHRQAEFQASVKMNEKGVVKYPIAVHSKRLRSIYK